MRRTHMSSLLGVIFVLCFSLLARGQTPIPIFGDNTVCKGDTATYSVTPTPGLTYSWSTTFQGNVSALGSSNATVTWIGTGSGTVYAYGIDSLGDTIQAGNLVVAISPLPVPYITSNAQVGCQQLAGDSTKKGEQGRQLPPEILDDANGCPKVCEYSTVTYYAHDQPGTTYTWDVAGEVSFADMGDSCIVTWGPAGPGTVTVIATNAQGCVASKDICIEIIHRPRAIFYTKPDSTYNDNTTANLLNVCLGDNIIFHNISTGTTGSPIMTCYWDFGDGTVLPTGGPPSSVTHSYSSPGTYTVMLVVTNACNCRDTARMQIDVQPIPGVKITCPSVVCEGDTAGYKVHVPCGMYLWSVEGGTILNTPAYTDSIDVVWNNVDTTGFGYVIFDGAPCGGVCPGKTIIKVPVIKQNGHISGPLIVCPNKQYIYRLPQWPTTDFVWSVTTSTGATLLPTDQRNEIVVNTANPGTIVLKCNYTNTMLGCGGTATVIIQVQPAVSIIGPDKMCHKDTGNWTLSTGVGNWTLTLPGGGTYNVPSSSSFSYVFNTLGTYSLSVSGAFCAPDAIGFTVLPLPAPPDSLTGPNVACSGIPTQYFAKNPIPGTTFKWSAVTGTVNNATGPSTYANFTGTGPWVISVQRQETGGAHCLSAPISKTVASPVPNFNITGLDSPCQSTSHSYSIGYTDGDTYEWSIVPSTLGSVTSGITTPSATVLWNNVTSPGQTAKLIVKVRKCTSFYYDTLDVFVMAAPIITVAVDSDSVCSGTPVNFTVSSTPGLTGWTSITWDYGDGPPLPGGLSQGHTYTTTGATTNIAFTATVTIVDANGCATVSAAASPVWVKPAPVAHVSPDGPFVFCNPPVNINLVATVTSGIGATTNYAWSPGPSGPFANSMTATTFGSYSCTVTNSNGCSATSNVVSIIQACDTPCGPGTPPVLTVTPTLTSCGHVAITASSTGGFSPQWVYPPNSISPVVTATSFDADYDVAGNYQFRYIVFYVNNTGDTCYTDTTVSIIVPFIAGLKHTINCVSGSGYTVNLLDNSNFYPGVPLTHSYYLNGGLLTNNPGNMSATATGLGAGTYTLTQIVTSSGYPACTVSYNITLDTLPVASFNVTTPLPACEDWVDINFVNTSTPSSSTPPLTVLWNFGDGSTNSQWNVQRNYAAAGSYNVTLSVSNVYGCNSFANVTVQVDSDKLDGLLTSAPSAPCQGDPVTVSYVPGVGTVYPTSYTWNETDNVLYSNIPSSSITVFEPGGYWANGTNSIGCIVNTPIHVVDITQVPPAVITGDSSQCVDGEFTLNGWAGDNITNYVWIIDGVAGPMGNTPTLDQVFSTPGAHTYRVVIFVPKPGGGYCTDTSDVFIVVINPLPPAPWPTFSILNCNTYQIQLSATNTQPGTFTWSNGASGTPVYTYTGGPYKVWFTDVNGCKSSTNMFVPKDPRTFLWIFPSGCYTFCKDQLPFTLIGPNSLTNWLPWEWWHNGGIASSGWGPVLPLTVTTPGTYSLMLNNGYCSAMSDSMDLTVIPDCKDPCDQITMHIDGVYNMDGTPSGISVSAADDDKAAIAPPQNGPCDKKIIVTFNSTFGSTVGYSAWTTNGTITPTWGTIPPGASTTSFIFTPAAGFTSGWVYFTVSTWLGSDDVKCTYVDSFFFQCGKGGPGSLVVTEMSNGPKTHKDCEYAEMVVVNCRNSDDKYVDVRGWIMDDNSGNFNTTGCDGTVGITRGHYRLSYENMWAAVPVGSIIVIYNHDENCYNLPNNFTVQNNGSTNTYWIPIGGTPSAPYGTPHVERFGDLPVAPGNCRYCQGDYQVANSWVRTIGFYNRHDAFQVRCPGCTDLNPFEPSFYHGIGYGPDFFQTIPAGWSDLGGPVVHVDGTDRKFEFMGSTRPDLGNPAMWAPLTADPAGTPPPSLGNINSGLEAMIVDNKMELPCCKIEYPDARKGGGSDGKSGKLNTASQGIRVYPNPAKDMLYVEFPASAKATIRISDVQGRVIATQTLEDATHAQFDVRTLAPGLYMYHITTDDKVQSGKVLIQK